MDESVSNLGVNPISGHELFISMNVMDQLVSKKRVDPMVDTSSTVVKIPVA